MVEQKQNPLEKLLVGNQEKAVAMIEKRLAKDEKALYYATASIQPRDIFTWLPFIGNILKLIFMAKAKNYLLAVTRKNLLMIGIQKLHFEETGSFRSIPIETIRETKMTKYVLLYNLKLTLSDGKTLLFQELPFEYASGLKDAIDSAQGRPSTPM
jgi:hypothetical protein